MKKISLILICLSIIFVTGCNKEDVSKIKSDTKGLKNINELEKKSGSLTCKREATASDGISPSFEYYIKYKDDQVINLHSIEKVTSDNSTSLDEYEKAYNKINLAYKNLDYYDSNVIRTTNSVTRDTTINYEKINIEKLLKIEGEEDNIIENKKAKLSLWLNMSSKFGVKCVED